MKFLLTSAGLTTPDIVQACTDLVGKDPGEISFAIINEAHAVEAGDKRWISVECNRLVENFGGDIDFINLLALSSDEVRQRIVTKDVIYVLGGHTEYLMSVYNKAGFSELLNDMPEDKVYVGSSAGAMVVSTRMSLQAYKEIYGEQDDYGTDAYLGFVDFTFFPHLNSPHFKVRTTNMVKQWENLFTADTYCVEDTQAIFIDGDQQKFIGGNPLFIRDGKVVEI